jgi:hypothetical protein
MSVSIKDNKQKQLQSLTLANIISNKLGSKACAYARAHDNPKLEFYQNECHCVMLCNQTCLPFKKKRNSAYSIHT